MWTPKWYDVAFALLTHPATWVVVGLVLVLLAILLLRAAWRMARRAVRKGGAT